MPRPTGRILRAPILAPRRSGSAGWWSRCSTSPKRSGLLALMLLHEARRTARVDASGDLVLLEDQDRALWNRVGIAEAQSLIERALASRRIGPYVLQAAIVAVHADAPSAGETDWAEIVALYDVLLRIEPSPVVALNRAAALGMRDGPKAGLASIEAALGRRPTRRLRARPFRPRRHAAPARPRRSGVCLLPTRARTDAPARRAPVSATPAGSTGGWRRPSLRNEEPILPARCAAQVMPARYDGMAGP